jgi:4-carboxymuconolactone decarboxylase
LLPLDKKSEASRFASVQQLLGTASPGLDHFTTSTWFREVWLRPDLSPRDRSRRGPLLNQRRDHGTGGAALASAALNRRQCCGLARANPQIVSKEIS